MIINISSEQIIRFEMRLNNLMESAISARDAVAMARSDEMKRYWERCMNAAISTKDGILWMLDGMGIDYEIIRRNNGGCEFKLRTLKNGF